MCNCIIFWLIYFFLSFFLFKLPKFWVPDVYPSPVASCVKCQPPRDFVSLYSRVQQGEIIPADIFQIRQKRQTLTCSPLGKPETWNPDHWITGASLPLCGSRGGEHPLVLETGRALHLPSQHFKDEDAQGPPVHCPAVAFALDDFGGQVLRGATQRPGPEEGKNTNTVDKAVRVVSSIYMTRFHSKWLRLTVKCSSSIETRDR